MRRPWSLRARLVAATIGLLAVVSAVIATVTTIALSSYLYDQLDHQLAATAARSAGPGAPTDGVSFLAQPGQPIGTIGGLVDANGEITDAAVSREPGGPGPADPADRLTTLDEDQIAALEKVEGSAKPSTVEVPGLGEYRVVTLDSPHGASVLVGLPTAQVAGTVDTLIVVESLVAGTGLLAAGIAAAVAVRLALRPLRRVAATASRVSELPLSSGEVSLTERVPDADPRTEVGQVGTALNRLLGHVGAALKARHDSETRVRRFVADASHELRTPLASIRGYAELTRRGHESIGPDTRHALGRIESESTRMTGLVEDLLLLARLDSGRPLAMTDVDLSALLVDTFSDAQAAETNASSPEPLAAGADGAVPTEADDAAGSAEPLAAAAAADEEAAGSAASGPATPSDAAANSSSSSGPAAAAGHRWVLELPDEPVTVRADRDRLHQVLANILANARVHTPAGTTVTGRVEHVDAGAVVVIRDDGPGIPPHLLPQVFQRFTRGDSSRSRASGSTGLGLAIVEAVIGAHDGEVSIDSEPGATTVRITLP
ncbi:ATP-binding protein [Stackebrandtia nassauensis]|uniref:histidine kinase n=1 Tax=Stackebrandtia nassauensis (strain DSM 44728 / CIP 108903 / NRRL B-16338 / NBRC 102104 / LLR-40K-21) TaxID=446470 RepID=D3QBZ9_STANL|nr:ATP-binding protein [Stackebrandtia nassauensis]ADD44888.1 histidine kinase [Stackebrandtia nassauensis DSM 44728]